MSNVFTLLGGPDNFTYLESGLARTPSSLTDLRITGIGGSPDLIRFGATGNHHLYTGSGDNTLLHLHSSNYKLALEANNSSGVFIEVGTDWVADSVADLIFTGMYQSPEHMRLTSGGHLGIGVNPQGVFHSCTNGAYDSQAIMERLNAVGSGGQAMLRCIASSEVDMVDGFGPVINFGIRDNTVTTYGSANLIGQIDCKRDGHDGSGKFSIRPRKAGSVQTGLVVTQDNRVGIGIDTPESALHIKTPVDVNDIYVIAKFEDSTTSGDGYLSIEDGISVDNHFVPLIRGRGKGIGSGGVGLFLVGEMEDDDTDVYGMLFQVQKYGPAALTTAPAYTFRNYTTELMTLSTSATLNVNGNITINDSAPTNMWSAKLCLGAVGGYFGTMGSYHSYWVWNGYRIAGGSNWYVGGTGQNYSVLSGIELGQNGIYFLGRDYGSEGTYGYGPLIKGHLDETGNFTLYGQGSSGFSPNLYIEGSADSDPRIWLKSNNTTEGSSWWYDNNVGGCYYDQIWSSGADATAAHTFRTRTGGTPITAMYINMAGNVFIPSYLYADRYVIQNSIDGTSAKGIHLWTATDNNWAIYMSQAGAGKSIADGTACTPGTGETTHAMRFRVYRAGTAIRTWIFEGSDEICYANINSNGMMYVRTRIGINVNPSYPLHVNANAVGYTGVFVNTGNHYDYRGVYIRAGYYSPSGNGHCRWLWFADGDGTERSYVGYSTSSPYAAFYAVSDRRLKTDIGPTKVNGLDVITGLKLYEYGFKNKKVPFQKIGFIAQQAREIYPNMVSATENKKDILTLSDSCLIPVLVKAVQEQQETIKQYEERIAALEALNG